MDPKGFVVPGEWICLESVTLNHNPTSNTSDALNIRKNRNEDVVVPEWQKAKQASPAAYIRNKTITVKAVFSAAASVTDAKIQAAVGYGALGELTQQTVPFTNGSSGDVTFNVVGSTPNDVRSFYQKWKWHSSDVNGSGSPEVHLADSKNKIFIVLTEQQSPWTTSGQTEPWTEVLTKSCWWAHGETTPEGAASKIAKRIYNDLGGLYDYGPKYTSWTTEAFELTNFLANIPSIGIVNCYDMGKSLVIFSNIVGCGLSYKLSMPFGFLNCEKAVGSNWNCNEFFGNHGFGSISNNIFDACLTVDTDSDPANGPPYLETWMLNVPWTSYKANVVKSGSPGNPVPYIFGIF